MLGGIYQFPEGQIIALALVFLRILAFVIAWPIFGTSTVPVHVKVLLALGLSILIFPVANLQNFDLLKIGDQIVFLAFREIAVGLFLGFLMRMFFFAVSVCGEVLSISTGLSSAQIFNPASGTNSNVMEQFQLLLATLLFLSVSGHHLFIVGLAKSFEILPVSDFGIRPVAFSGAAFLVKDVMLMGIKMSAPVMLAVFLANIAMGVLGRAVPQINVMVTSLSVQISVGLGVLFVTLPLMLTETNSLLDLMADRFFAILKVM